MNVEIENYNNSLSEQDKLICNYLETIISNNLKNAESKIWHRHPVWFLNGNPIVGYHKLKNCIRILFWSGQSFDEEILKPEGSFKAAEIRINFMNELNEDDLIRCLNKAQNIQWDYKNIVKRKGKLERLLYN